MSSRVLATNAFWSLLSHVLHRGSLMMAAILMARNLETRQFAAYSYFQLTIFMLATYAAMGLGVTASRYFAEFGHEGGHGTAPLGTLLTISLAMAVASFCLVLLIPSGWLSADLPVPQWMISLGVAVTVAGVVPSGGILGLEKYRQASLISMFSAMVMLSVTWLAILHQSASLGMWAIIISLTVQCSGQLLVIVRAVGWQTILTTCRWTSSDLHKLGNFAGPMFVVSILAGSSTWVVGRLVLAGSGEKEFAAYSIGLQWFALGLLLPGIVSRVVLPRLVRINYHDAKGLVRLGAAMALAPALLMVICGWILASSLIDFYGPDYENFAFVIPTFLGIAVFSAPLSTIGSAILARNGQIVWLLMTLVSFFTLVLILVAAPTANVTSASTAHFVATVLMLLMAWIYGKMKKLL